MKNQIEKYVSLFAGPVFWLVLLAITILSLWPGHSDPPTSPWSDKINHALAYFVLGVVFLAKGFSAKTGLVFSRTILRGFLVLWMFSGLMELIQGTQLIGRTSSLLDLLANGSGLVLALLIGQMVVSMWQKE